MKLELNWKDFETQVNEFKIQGEKISDEFKNGNSQSELENLNSSYKKWQSELVDFLRNSFDEKNNEFANGIRQPQNNRFNIGNRQKTSKELIKKKIEDINSLNKTLKYYLRILDISDAIVRPNEIDLDKRKNATTDEILELILEKLFKLYDDSYHPISAILSGNGIELARYNEERELTKTLEDNGLIRCMNARNVNAQLTLEGKRYIENKRKSETTDYSKINKSQEELNEKIDEIIDTLKKQDFGQEILFNELQELKELYSKLNKKNWGQLLKGKLIDLGLAQVINKEVMGEIFSELTEQILKIK